MALVDDLIDLKYWIKLIVQIVAALIAVSSGVVIEVVSNPNIFSSNPWLILGVSRYRSLLSGLSRSQTLLTS